MMTPRSSISSSPDGNEYTDLESLFREQSQLFGDLETTVNDKAKEEESKNEARESSFQKVTDKIAELEKNVKSKEGVIDPNVAEIRLILSELKPMMSRLKAHYDILREQETKIEHEPIITKDGKRRKKIKAALKKAKTKFISAVRRMNRVISKLNAAMVVTEADSGLNVSTEEYNATFNEFETLMDKYASLKRDATLLSRLETAKKISTYSTYATAATKGGFTATLAWIDSLKDATKMAGTIFYPITASFNTLIRMISFISRLGQYYVAHRESKNPAIDWARKQELERTKALLRESMGFKSIAFVLNAISILAFVGVMATPVGFALIAAATLADWIDEGLGGYRRAKEGLKEFKDKHQNKALNADEQTELRDLLERRKLTATKARWGFANVVALALIACAPIPLAGPFLSVAGLGIMGIVTIRNAIVAAKPYVQKFKNYLAARKAGKNEPTEPILEKQEIELGLRSSNQLDRTRSPTMLLRSASLPNLDRDATNSTNSTTAHIDTGIDTGNGPTKQSWLLKQNSLKKQSSEPLLNTNSAKNDPAMIKDKSSLSKGKS